MAGFDDIVAEAMPYMARELLTATAGASWDVPYEVRDSTNTLVTWPTGSSVMAAMYPTKSGSAATLTFTATLPGPGLVRFTATPAQTEPLTPGVYYHEVEVTEGGTGRKVKLVGSGDSRILVKAEVAP